jgi:hypothetical protein
MLLLALSNNSGLDLAFIGSVTGLPDTPLYLLWIGLFRIRVSHRLTTPLSHQISICQSDEHTTTLEYESYDARTLEHVYGL